MYPKLTFATGRKGSSPGIDRLAHQEHKRGGRGTPATREQRSALTARAMALDQTIGCARLPIPDNQFFGNCHHRASAGIRPQIGWITSRIGSRPSIPPFGLNSCCNGPLKLSDQSLCGIENDSVKAWSGNWCNAAFEFSITGRKLRWPACARRIYRRYPVARRRTGDDSHSVLMRPFLPAGLR